MIPSCGDPLSVLLCDVGIRVNTSSMMNRARQIYPFAGAAAAASAVGVWAWRRRTPAAGVPDNRSVQYPSSTAYRKNKCTAELCAVRAVESWHGFRRPLGAEASTADLYFQVE